MTTTTSKNKQKIARVSKVLKDLCTVFMFLNVLGLIGLVPAWLFFHFLPPAQPIEPNAPAQLVVPGWLIPILVIEFMSLRSFRGFFAGLEQGHLFDAATIAWLAAAGRWKFIAWVCALVAALFQAADFTGLLDQLGGVVAPLAIIFVAWLLHEGQSLQEEQNLTV